MTRPTTDAAVEAVFAEAVRALHPTDGPLNVALSRIAALERDVGYLTQRGDLLGRMVDLLDERDGELERVVAPLVRRREHPDHRLGEVLALIFEYAQSTTWTCGELVEDARRDRPALWIALDAITGSRGNPAVRLGLWMQRHIDIEADGLRLERVRQECGSWTYRVVEQD